MSGLTVRECATLAEAGPPEAWGALVARPPASHAASRAWAEAAFAEAHPGARPLVLAVEEAGCLVGLLSLALHDTGGGRRVVRFAGAPHNDLTDVAALPGRAGEVALAVAAALPALARRGWTIELEALDPDGALARSGGLAELDLSDDEAAPWIDLRNACGPVVSARRRRQWDRALRRLRERHVVEFRRVEGVAVPEVLRAFTALREQRLRAKGRPVDLPPVAFMQAVVRRAAETGRVAFAEMVVDGRPVARDLYQVEPPVAMLWLRALDDRWRRFSCGHLLLVAASRRFAAEGFEVLDLGRGDEPYKFVFGAQQRTLLRATIGRG